MRDPAVVLVDAVGFSCRSHGLQIFLLASVSLLQSIQSNVLPFVQPCIVGGFDVSLAEVAWMPAISFLASAVAGVIFGPLADIIGRRPATLLGLLLLSLTWVAMPFAPSFMWLCVLTGLAGVAMADYMPSLTLIAETTPNDVRGRILNTTNFLWSTGTTVVVLAAWATLPQAADASGRGPPGGGGWRVLIGAFAPFSVLALLASYCVLRESPLWLLSRGRDAEARRVLEATAASSKARSRSSTSVSDFRPGPCSC